MKKRMILCLIVGLSFCSINVSAKIPILYGLGEEISLVKELPNEDLFTVQADDGVWHHAYLGVIYQQFSLFYIPIWNYGDYKYVLFTDTKVGEYDCIYAELSRQEVAYLQTLYSDIPDEPKLSFWTSVGGKLLSIGLVILIFIFSKKYNKKDDLL